MRLIGTFANDDQARKFGHFLKSQKIESNCEVSFDTQTGHMSYQFWAHDEDQLAVASALLEEFKKNPSDPKYDIPIGDEPVQSGRQEELAEEPPSHRFGTSLTTFILSLCVMVFFLNTIQEIPLRKESFPGQSFLMTPIQSALLYDVPPPFEKIEEIIEKYEVEAGEKKVEIPPQVIKEVESLSKSSYWQGFYEWIVLKINKKETSTAEGALFIKIRQGEIWRLFTPTILHFDLLHILFNMLWLWYLCRPIEQRIGPFRTLVLTLLLGVGTNTLQYFMSGPFFIGYSGVITGLAGFTWMREKIAPWEGYPLNRATILFLAIFISAILILQMTAFFIQIFSLSNFSPNIANTAHIGGAIMGAIIGRYSFFGKRVK